ncbi:hypothetical protein, conserved [Trypanosoma brucei gambiense DAL972]|uniref:Uncharacterized protein n=1 Tax=Trypanosoma brucei gambiense (strain MHOM/CI/86/DAL972) TaxID=679716 RepID=D0A211_TRYB9|nr:hypothetical protein, conserved [Trypanosoma brucei gambiense DAL972]CBH15304.1 hypothetical protein, conserved [Trypanosoma brucei gambiense DAL972]|eukprot:XP_011777569.1 hypothetical protein, conserved [Trypanosoma brucei gambiense DAL972]
MRILVCWAVGVKKGRMMAPPLIFCLYVLSKIIDRFLFFIPDCSSFVWHIFFRFKYFGRTLIDGTICYWWSSKVAVVMDAADATGGGSVKPLAELIQLIRVRGGVTKECTRPRRTNDHSNDLCAVPFSLPVWKRARGHSPPRAALPVKESVSTRPELSTTVRRRRRRMEGCHAVTTRNVSTCSADFQIMEKLSVGAYHLTYVHVDLYHHGLKRLMDDAVLRTNPKKIVGRKCCYLKPGTDLVVTGCVIEFTKNDLSVQVAPDKGIDVDVEWVKLEDVYVPENIDKVRVRVSDEVRSGLQKVKEAPKEMRRRFASQ